MRIWILDLDEVIPPQKDSLKGENSPIPEKNKRNIDRDWLIKFVEDKEKGELIIGVSKYPHEEVRKGLASAFSEPWKEYFTTITMVCDENITGLGKNGHIQEALKLIPDLVPPSIKPDIILISPCSESRKHAKVAGYGVQEPEYCPESIKPCSTKLQYTFGANSRNPLFSRTRAEAPTRNPTVSPAVTPTMFPATVPTKAPTEPTKNASNQKPSIIPELSITTTPTAPWVKVP